MYYFSFLCVSVVKSQTVRDGIATFNRGDSQAAREPWKNLDDAGH
jgi:hypothetical protein